MSACLRSWSRHASAEIGSGEGISARRSRCCSGSAASQGNHPLAVQGGRGKFTWSALIESSTCRALPNRGNVAGSHTPGNDVSETDPLKSFEPLTDATLSWTSSKGPLTLTRADVAPAISGAVRSDRGPHRNAHAAPPQRRSGQFRPSRGP
jgi:hypothetical protein